MNPREIIELLQLGNFEPCVFITNSGHRYGARHPEFVHVTSNGTVRIYVAADHEQGEAHPFVRVAPHNIAAIELMSSQPPGPGSG